MFAPYKYKLPKKSRPQPAVTPKESGEDEGLTGFVQGKEASDLEERFARGLYKFGIDFQYEYPVDTAYTLPSQEKQVDFMVFKGQPRPVEIDGGFVHKSAEQREYDRERDAQINHALGPYGFLPVLRISGDELPDQEHADTVIETYIA